MGSSQKAAEEKSLLPAVQSLIQGIAVHAVKGDPDQDRQFRARMHRIFEAVSAQPTWMDAMGSADSAVSAFRDHTDQATKFHRANIAELRAAVQMLVGTLKDLTIGSPGRMQELQEIEKQMAAAAAPGALQECKLSLSRCLTEIREEAMRHRQYAGEHGLKDPVTGLDGREAAETAVAQACAADTPVCAVILLVDRLPLYNRRYGREVGDKVLRFFVETVQRALGAGLVLFRWTGPAVLLLREGSHDGIHAEMRRAFDPRLEFEVDSGSRSILLTIGVSWTVVPMMVEPRLVLNKIDAFVAD